MPLFPSAALISSSSSSKTKNHDEPKGGPQSTTATDSWLNIGSSYQQPLVGSVPVTTADHSLLSSVVDSIRSEEPPKKKRKHKKEKRTRSDKEHKKKKDKHSSKKKKHRRNEQDVTKNVIKNDDDRDYSSSDWSSDDETLPTTSASSSAAAVVHKDRERRRDQNDRIHSSVQQQVVVHGKPTITAALPRDVIFLPDGRMLLTAPKQTETAAPNAELYHIDRRADKDLLTFGHYRLDIPNYVLSTERGIRPLAHLVKNSHQLPRFYLYSMPD